MALDFATIYIVYHFSRDIFTPNVIIPVRFGKDNFDSIRSCLKSDFRFCTLKWYIWSVYGLYVG